MGLVPIDAEMNGVFERGRDERFFDEDIEDIIFEGYSDYESEEFREALPVLLEKMAEFQEN